MFNKVIGMLEAIKLEGVESNVESIEMMDVPFIDEFISKFIYREQPYTLEETRSLLPYFETLQEVAEWAVWDTDYRGARSRILSFKNRFDSLVKALHVADKYGLEVQMSY